MSRGRTEEGGLVLRAEAAASVEAEPMAVTAAGRHGPGARERSGPDG